MTELEMIERAKMYMDKLANGVNPIDDTLAPEEDIINNVRLSRCFFFVSDVLRRVIENGGTEPARAKKRPPKVPLDIPFEARAQFAYSDSPISASEIAKRVNDLIEDDRMEKLTYANIVTWLTEIGMMEWAAAPDGKRAKLPTKTGAENGILVESREGGNGPYQAVVYNRAAQQFLVDNLDAILAAENHQAELQGTPWTKEQDERLIALYNQAAPAAEIAVALKRRTSAIYSRLKKLGLEAR